LSFPLVAADSTVCCLTARDLLVGCELGFPTDERTQSDSDRLVDALSHCTVLVYYRCIEISRARLCLWHCSAGYPESRSCLVFHILIRRLFRGKNAIFSHCRSSSCKILNSRLWEFSHTWIWCSMHWSTKTRFQLSNDTRTMYTYWSTQLLRWEICKLF
jgi:hypothetical protein